MPPEFCIEHVYTCCLSFSAASTPTIKGGYEHKIQVKEGDSRKEATWSQPVLALLMTFRGGTWLRACISDESLAFLCTHKQTLSWTMKHCMHHECLNDTLVRLEMPCLA